MCLLLKLCLFSSLGGSLNGSSLFNNGYGVVSYSVNRNSSLFNNGYYGVFCNSFLSVLCFVAARDH